MPSDVVPIRQGGDIIEQVITKGDLAKLTPQERVTYYRDVCHSVGLNPLTRPLEFITLSGRLVLYARRDAADQLRKINGISLEVVSQKIEGDMLTVHVRARDKTGRTDEDFGVVSIAGLRGEARANATLKAVTKAKRRVTLSIAGLGFLDETEVDDIPARERIGTAAGMAADTTADLDQFAAVTGDAEPIPPRDILTEARETAECGTVYFRQYFAALSPAERAMLRPHMDEYKQLAEAADARAKAAMMEDNPDDPFGLPHVTAWQRPVGEALAAAWQEAGAPAQPDDSYKVAVDDLASPGARDVFRELEHEARAATKEGAAAFSAWWKTLRKADKDLLNAFKAEYEQMAADADSQRGLAL